MVIRRLHSKKMDFQFSMCTSLTRWFDIERAPLIRGLNVTPIVGGQPSIHAAGTGSAGDRSVRTQRATPRLCRGLYARYLTSLELHSVLPPQLATLFHSSSALAAAELS